MAIATTKKATREGRVSSLDPEDQLRRREKLEQMVSAAGASRRMTDSASETVIVGRMAAYVSWAGVGRGSRYHLSVRPCRSRSTGGRRLVPVRDPRRQWDGVSSVRRGVGADR